MGTTILIITSVFEAAFATYCVVTKSSQQKVRSWVRIGALAALVVFTLVSVIEWSFRWYALAALLVVWAALGAWALLRKTADKKQYAPGHTVFSALLALLLVGLAVTPALIFPQLKLPPATGKHAVATAQYTYTDASRIETFTKTGENRKVNVEFWYPKDGGGKYPLVVFSHGSLGMKTSNSSTFLDLASNGYVVCSIDHPYHALLTSGDDRRMVIADQGYLQEVVGINNGNWDEQRKFETMRKWLALRTADINFVLDTILAHAKDGGSGAVYQLIDAGKIGLMGHSMGGAATAQVARQRNDIGAEINLDADLFGEYLDYVNGHYVLNDKPYPVPILTVLADDMVRLLAAVPNPNDVVAVKHVLATAPHAYEVHLTGTDHMSLTDVPLISPLLVAVVNSSVPKAGGVEAQPLATLERMNALVLDFFDAYLKGDGSFSVAGAY